MKNCILLLMLTLWSCILQAQAVKISNNNLPPDSSAILDVESTAKGFLPPRMTTADRNLISNPAEGLQIYNTTTGCLNFFVAGGWREVCPECEFSKPVAFVSSPVCEGDSVQLTVNNIPGASYIWTGPNGYSSNMEDPWIANILPVGSGNYSVEATVSGCSRNSDPVNLTVSPGPSTATAGSSINSSGIDTLFQDDFDNPPASGMTIGGNASYNVNTLQLTPVAGSQWGYAYLDSIKPLMNQIGSTRNQYYFEADMFHGGGSGADEHTVYFGDSADVVSKIIGNAGPGPIDGASLGIQGLLVFYCSYSACRYVRVFYNGATIGTYSGFPWRNSTVPTSIEVDSIGAFTLRVNNSTILTGNLPATYTNADKSSWTWAFAGRTGGATDFHRLDNMLITSQPSTKTVNLNATPPTVGTGSWTIISGTGGSIASPNDPQSSFTGSYGENYILQWTVTNSCGSSTDQVSIQF